MITMIGFTGMEEVSGDHSSVFVHHKHTYAQKTVNSHDPPGSQQIMVDHGDQLWSLLDDCMYLDFVQYSQS